MTDSQYMIWFIVSAILIIAILVTGTLLSAGIWGGGTGEDDVPEAGADAAPVRELERVEETHRAA